MIDLEKLKNPLIDKRPKAFLRDPAIIFHEGTLKCFHTTVEETTTGRRLYLEMSESEDLREWRTTRLTTSELNFSSPGNIVWDGKQWILCVQSYPINPGELWGNDNSRLWLMFSDDLTHWSEPEVIMKNGCACDWVNGPRQIDPYLVHHDNEYYCFYKAESKYGAIKSKDLKNWEELSPHKPIISHKDIPDRRAVENPCIIKDDAGRFMLFFSPCRENRGIGVAYSNDLVEWRDFQYLDFPNLSWAKNGPTAPAVIDMRETTGYWIMMFHGETVSEGHDAALGIAWSKNLIDWTLPRI